MLRGARARSHDTGYVVTYGGKPVLDIKRAFAGACRRAGLSGVLPHTLRHTCASWLAQAGVSFPKIAKYLGHANSRTTEQVYAKHAPDYLADVAAALDGKRRA
ncbi:MAG: tyrosine-type recombinase/integrase [Alphaproteobacteria bacterium]|nr:tyrosine-type recombinase/integrase [Alphaproteobacteria bacterium]